MDIDRQFIEMDAWFDDNKSQYMRAKWDNSNSNYIIIWAERYSEEMICEIWAPLETIDKDAKIM